jgi:archaetidylinositol phosphate synthase
MVKNERSKHKRLYPSPTEQKVIDFLLVRLPSWTTPDMMTIIGFLGSVVVGLGLFLTHFSYNYLFMSIFGFGMNWFGDSLDGQLARYRKRARPNYGYYIDKLVDCAAIFIICLGLGLSPMARLDISLLLCILYLLLSVHVVIITHLQAVADVTFNGIGPTEFRAIAAVVTFILFFVHEVQVTVVGFTFRIADLMILGLVCMLIFSFLIAAYRKARELRIFDQSRLPAK